MAYRSNTLYKEVLDMQQYYNVSLRLSPDEYSKLNLLQKIETDKTVGKVSKSDIIRVALLRYFDDSNVSTEELQREIDKRIELEGR
jgi:hypothetical protein